MSAFSLEPRILFDAAAAITAEATVPTENAVDSAVLDQQTTALLQSLNQVTQLNDNSDFTTESHHTSELIFVDSHIPAATQFSSLYSVNTEVFTLDSNQDGLTQIAAIAQNYNSLSNIRIITNLNNSGFEIGSTLLSKNDFSIRASDITEISQSLDVNGLLSFYSADNSSYLAGDNFVEKLAIFASGSGEFEAKKLIDASPEQNDGKHEIVFIDSNLSDWQQLVNSVRSGIEVVLINGQGNGLKAITHYLSGQREIDAIHIVSHSSRGELFLGTLDLTTSNLGDYQQNLADIGWH